MPTTYTTLLGLAKPATGELSGTWGDTVNSYITDYVDSAVAGAQIISGSQTAVTLSTTNGSALSQAGAGATGSAQYAIIRCTGNPASLLTVTAPAANKVYLVINATSTSQSVKVVGTGPTTGVTVAASRAALIAWNGSDFVLIATTDITQLSGTLAVANGGTGVTTSTGSGSNVLSNSPTLVTPTLGAASATSVALAAGAASSPSLTATGDTDTGLWFPAANTVAISTTGTERMRIDLSGNVGIGVTPTTVLTVQTSATGTTVGSNIIGRFQSTASGRDATLQLSDSVNVSTVSMLSGATAFAQNGTESMRITSGGNVGIGNTAPTSKLDVTGEIRASGTGGTLTQIDTTDDIRVTIYSDSSNEGVIECVQNSVTSTKKPLYLQKYGGNVYVGSGNVGIGTTSPSAKLAVSFSGATILASASDNTTSTSASYQLTNSAGTVVGRTIYYGPSYSGGSVFSVGANGIAITQEAAAPFAIGTFGVAQPLVFGTNSSERMRIDSSGNLLVATTSLTIGNIDGYVFNAGGALNIYRTSGASQAMIGFGNGGNFVGDIRTSTTATSYNTSSDYRLKHDIVPMTGALTKIAALKPVTYKWNADGSYGEGFIAHELAEIVPQCVTGEKDAVDEKGKPRYQGVDTSFLVATLTAAIQEQQAIIKSLTDRIAALEAKGA